MNEYKKYIKNGNVLIATNRIQEDAYVSSGYIEVVVSEKEIATSLLPFSDDKPIDSITKSEIMRMKKADLVSLADTVGIDSTMSGADIKSALVKHYGL